MEKINTIFRYYYNPQIEIKLDFLPEHLIEFNCRYANYRKIKYKLPTELRRLFCEFNKLKKLPKPNNKLRQIWCYNNRLVKLPSNIQINFNELICHNNEFNYKIKFDNRRRIKFLHFKYRSKFLRIDKKQLIYF